MKKKVLVMTSYKLDLAKKGSPFSICYEIFSTICYKIPPSSIRKEKNIFNKRLYEISNNLVKQGGGLLDVKLPLKDDIAYVIILNKVRSQVASFSDKQRKGEEYIYYSRDWEGLEKLEKNINDLKNLVKIYSSLQFTEKNQKIINKIKSKYKSHFKVINLFEELIKNYEKVTKKDNKVLMIFVLCWLLAKIRHLCDDKKYVLISEFNKFKELRKFYEILLVNGEKNLFNFLY